MKRLHAYGCLIFVSTTVLLHAQQPAKPLPPIPPGPLIQTRAPDFSEWVTTLTQRKDAAADNKTAASADQAADSATPAAGKFVVLSVVTTTKTGPLKERKLIDATGATWDTWCMGELQITLRPDSGGPLIFRGKQKIGDIPSPYDIDYSQSDFPEITIVSLPNYAGIETVSNVKCLVFKAMATLVEDAPAGEVTAYVDLVTRLPVALKGGSQTRTYQFLAPPTSQLTLPPEVQNLIDMDHKINQSGTGWRPQQ